MFRRVPPGTSSRLTTVDHGETYGRHVLQSVVRSLSVSACVDIGCGHGDDLRTVLAQHPAAQCFGVDYGDWNTPSLEAAGISPVSVNIEAEPLPLASESVDLVIANQVLEHTKEIYWINHEIFRVLKVGGCLYLGVPNVLSLHNRLLGLVGVHPTCNKMISAHVRPFSKADTLLFYRAAAPELTQLTGFYGSQFYPFPKRLARPLANLFPTCAFSIFFLLKKVRPYGDEFVNYLSQVHLETNFFRG
ncbi:class I SAM-dependent methyltransferase [Leptolyngbya sp. KIOST-1]|uniref:class I SAM-dependent methyltransferase n=1 Tax=Leptolyngbya sp. KIOST-1 TaxID=1229172 RepID=UPI00068A0B2E|nr:class I SAM-dependent methyltransferase [Leptolyngbya sp. KIOST-1]